MAQDYIGQRFGRLTVLEMLSGKRKRFRCQCDCGQTTVALAGNIKASKTSSCGCLRKELTGSRRRSHGATRTRTYRIWRAMKTRCSNPNIREARWYSGKGIKVCDRWNDSFEAFLSDMGEAPDGLTLDRINSEEDYGPGNCRWATMLEQSHNRSDNVWVTYEGQRMVVSEAERAAGLTPGVVRGRIRRGWPEQDWFIPEVGKGRRRSP